eukprot:TRINITY_DN4117_c0_g1_i5.p1 TRINITY_DN4117_c0_g1~~TRINITY_DN4117_c0_g1_i5.p1  ORF type:complete len:445 (+),score=96.86 TRINITY_DN4117_c0_g1_i5:873-2207(+)
MIHDTPPPRTTSATSLHLRRSSSSRGKVPFQGTESSTSENLSKETTWGLSDQNRSPRSDSTALSEVSSEEESFLLSQSLLDALNAFDEVLLDVDSFLQEDLSQVPDTIKLAKDPNLRSSTLFGPPLSISNSDFSLSSRKRRGNVESHRGESGDEKRRKPELPRCLGKPFVDHGQRIHHPGVFYEESDGEVSITEVDLSGLVACLLQKDLMFVETIIVLHDTFISAQDLLAYLTMAYNKAKREKDTLSQQKVVNILKGWMQHGWGDFETNALFLADFMAFVKELGTSNELLESKWGSTLRSHYNAEEDCKKDLLKAALVSSLEGAPPVCVSKKLIENFPSTVNKAFLLDFNPLEFARQIAIFDYQNFSSIPISEFICKRFEKEQLSPNLTMFSQSFSLLVDLVGTEVLSQSSPKFRAKMILYFLNVAEPRLWVSTDFVHVPHHRN